MKTNPKKTRQRKYWKCKILVYNKKAFDFLSLLGALAEQLGSGLQNRVERCNSATHLHAAMVELVDTQDLKSCTARCVGSIPPRGTKIHQ